MPRLQPWLSIFEVSSRTGEELEIGTDVSHHQCHVDEKEQRNLGFASAVQSSSIDPEAGSEEGRPGSSSLTENLASFLRLDSIRTLTGKVGLHAED